jgi:hypothetical protein
MDYKFTCTICNLKYKTKEGIDKHNRKYHPIPFTNTPKKYLCSQCSREFNSRQTKWKHVQNCKLKKKSLKQKIDEISEKLQILEQKPNNITNNITNNNITNNIQYVINAPTSSTLEHLTFEDQKYILDQNLNSITSLIERVNFNKYVPKNHSYCVTAINDKHASVIDEKTNTIVKTNKEDLYGVILTTNLNNLEKIALNSKFTKEQKEIYFNKINYLKKEMYRNNKFIKRYYSDINLISYNNKNMIKETWKKLKPIKIALDEVLYESNDEHNQKRFDILLDELQDHDNPFWLKQKSKLQIIPLDVDSDDSSVSSESNDSETEECNVSEITIKDKQYILDGTNVYIKNNNGIKGEIYGIYLNNKVKKIIKTKKIVI